MSIGYLCKNKGKIWIVESSKTTIWSLDHQSTKGANFYYYYFFKMWNFSTFSSMEMKDGFSICQGALTCIQQQPSSSPQKVHRTSESNLFEPFWHSNGLPYFMHLLAFRRLFWASLSNSYRDFANLYVARRLRLPSCILVSTSKGIWGCYRVASLDGPSLIKEILRKWKHNWATLLLSHCIHPFHLPICLRMIWYRKFQHRA